jgi:membrane protease YdiL (CAAX protease family)
VNNKDFWKIISLIELLISFLVIFLDLFIPTIIILGIMIISLLIRKEKISSLGFKKTENAFGMVVNVLLLVIIWTFLQLALFMPVLNHLTGTTQDLRTFENLKGNLGNLLFFLILTWTLAAFGEEIVYRGYLQKRIYDMFENPRIAIFSGIAISSLLFGLAHTEQGLIGVTITTLDAIFFSLLKIKYDNMWAPILAHGFSNTIGLTAFFFVGPIYGLW